MTKKNLLKQYLLSKIKDKQKSFRRTDLGALVVLSAFQFRYINTKRMGITELGQLLVIRVALKSFL